MKIIKISEKYACYFTLLILFLTSCGTNKHQDMPLVPDCNDQIQNQGELGVDCDGPCNACPSSLNAKIDGMQWQSAGMVNSLINDSSIIILSGNGTSTLSLIYTGEFKPGVFNLKSASYGITANSLNYVANTGTITFFSWNLTENQVFGTFSFDAYDVSGSGDTLHFRDGQFKYVPFQL